jgi:ribosomal protein L32
LLITCQECASKISQAAAVCLGCGAPQAVFLGSASECAECGGEYRRAFEACMKCGAPREVATGVGSRVSQPAVVGSPTPTAEFTVPPNSSDQQSIQNPRVASAFWVFGALGIGALLIAAAFSGSDSVADALAWSLGESLPYSFPGFLAPFFFRRSQFAAVLSGAVGSLAFPIAAFAMQISYPPLPLSVLMCAVWGVLAGWGWHRFSAPSV